ncbi:MAG: hypothetical protein ACYC63_13085 [Armatimonadota bacterium]
MRLGGSGSTDGQETSDEDAVEAIQNITAFFDLLAEWDREANPDQEPPQPDSAD